MEENTENTVLQILKCIDININNLSEVNGLLIPREIFYQKQNIKK